MKAITSARRCFNFAHGCVRLSVCLVLSLLLYKNACASSYLSKNVLTRLGGVTDVAAYKRGLAVNALLNELRTESADVQILEVNRYFNAYAYMSDIELWGVADYWATPEEFIGAYAGDCEDYVVAKYTALRFLGIDDEKLYLTYVQAKGIKIAHMVLSYFTEPGGVPLILDNYEPKIMRASLRDDLLPVYAFNAKSLFLTNPSAGLGRALPSDKVKNSKWSELLQRLDKVAVP